VIRRIFFEQCENSNTRKGQKDEARNLKPKLVKHAAKVTEACPRAAQDGPIRAAALHLLSGNPCRNA